MRRFRFRLETLLRVTRARRDAARRDALEARLRWLECEEQAQRCEVERLEADRHRDVRLRAGTSGGELRAVDGARDGLAASAGEARRERDEAKRERERRLRDLADLTRRSRTLEDMKERFRRRHLREEDRREQKWVDELFSLLRLHEERAR